MMNGAPAKVLAKPQKLIVIEGGDGYACGPIDIVELQNGNGMLMGSSFRVVEWSFDRETTKRNNKNNKQETGKKKEKQEKEKKKEEEQNQGHIEVPKTIKYEHHSVLVDEDTLVVYKDRTVYLHSRRDNNDTFDERVLVNTNGKILKIRIWKSGPLGALMAVHEYHHDCRLRVWSLKENRSVYDRTNVSCIFEDGFYTVRIIDGDYRAYQIRNYTMYETDQFICDDVGTPLELIAADELKHLIQLNNGNFVTLSHKSHSLDLWSRHDGTCSMKIMTGHTSSKITLKETNHEWWVSDSSK